MSTRVDVRKKLQQHFNNTVYYDDQSLNDSIQDGMDEIAAFTGCIYKSVELPFTQFTTYYDLLALCPDYIGVVAIFNKVIRRWLWPGSLKKFNQDRIDWDVSYGTPYHFCPISHRYVAIYKKPAVATYGNFIMFYRAAAPTFADNTIIPLPDEHITCLETYSIADLWEQAQEYSKATEGLKVYINNLENLRVLMRNQRNRDRYMSLK
jgi:hypothetical protein